MTHNLKIDRRTFVALSSLTALAPSGLAAEWKFFTAEEAALAESICDCIIPGDQDPGAVKAGVIHYIDLQVAGPLSRFASAYRKGLSDFAETARNDLGAAFQSLTLDKRTAFLTKVEKTNLAGLGGFFSMMIDHTMQGFYGSPEHGGNRDGASWKMLGVEHFMHDGPMGKSGGHA